MNSVVLVDKGIELKAEAEAFYASSGAVLLTNFMQTDDCMGDALRGQSKGKSQLKFTLNSNGLVNNGIEFKAEADAFDASSGAVSLTNNMQTDDCVGDAFRGHIIVAIGQMVSEEGLQALTAGCPGLQCMVREVAFRQLMPAALVCSAWTLRITSWSARRTFRH